jgi:hypothetical protein
MPGQGQATLNFGAATGGTSYATAAVTGQAAILAGSQVEAWKRLVATADHSADEHRIESLVLTAGAIVAGVGFTIYGEIEKGRSWGQFTVDWIWA